MQAEGPNSHMGSGTVAALGQASVDQLLGSASVGLELAVVDRRFGAVEGIGLGTVPDSGVPFGDSS